jgi:hypothetical protein
MLMTVSQRLAPAYHNNAAQRVLFDAGVKATCVLDEA